MSVLDKAPIPCFVCEIVLENVTQDGNQPYNAIEFTSGGHYGCTEFDPMDGTFLAINICDLCLVRAKQKNLILVGEPSYAPPKPPPSLKIWRE